MRRGYSQLDWIKLHKDLPRKGPRPVTLRELSEHNSEYSCWSVYQGKVYNLTEYMLYHPGGREELMEGAGADMTSLFQETHAWVNIESLLANCYIGPLVDEPPTPALPAAGAGAGAGPGEVGPAFRPQSWTRLPLLTKSQVARDTFCLRFIMPGGVSGSGLLPGQHVEIRVDGKGPRPYTPISSPGDAENLELLVKAYAAGTVSRALAQLTTGSSIEVRGPLGAIQYLGAGRFSAFGKPVEASLSLTLIAGGTGITPLYLVAKAVAEEAEQQVQGQGAPQTSLIFANHQAEDVPMRQELAALGLPVTYVLTDDSGDPSATPGRVGVDLLRELLPAPAPGHVVAWCGPVGFNNAVRRALNELGFEEGAMLCF